MKIRTVRIFFRENEQAVRTWQRHFWQFGVELETDTGLKGLGVGGAGAAGAAVARHALAPLVTGRDPFAVETFWDEMYQATLPYGRRGVALMAMSAIDLALWDLVAQARGLPVWRCLRDWSPPPVRAYATTSRVLACRELGFSAFKLPISVGPAAGAEGMARIESEVAQARAAAGDKAHLMIDCWMGWDSDYTLTMAERLAVHRLAWIEEPLPPDDRAGYARLQENVASTRIATGEHEYGWHGYEDLLTGGLASVLQPDVTWCGGLTPARRIWQAAASRGLLMAPHRGGEVWGLHLNFAFGGEWAEVVCLEGRLFHDPLVEGSPQPEGGYFSAPTAPGFGVRWRAGIDPGGALG
jgi:L-rhamnonate dehydratase